MSCRHVSSQRENRRPSFERALIATALLMPAPIIFDAPSYSTFAQEGLSESGRWNNKGMKLRDKEKFNDAIKCFQRAVELDPHYNRAYVNMGEAYMKGKHDTRSAKTCFEKAIEIDAKDPFAWHNMATVMDAIGDLKRAERACKRALALESASNVSAENSKNYSKLKFKTLSTLTKLYLRMNRLEDAQETLSNLRSNSEAETSANQTEIGKLQKLLEETKARATTKVTN